MAVSPECSTWSITPTEALYTLNKRSRQDVFYQRNPFCPKHFIADADRKVEPKNAEVKQSLDPGEDFSFVAPTRQHAGMAVVVVYAIHQGASVLLAYAGRTSAASLFLSIVAKGSLTVKISLAFGGLSTILFFLEHRRHI